MTLEFGPQRSNDKFFLNRLWQYQRERFPLFAHGFALAAFTLAALSVSASFEQVRSWPDVITFTASFTSVLGFFLLLRIADEFKDAGDDARFRSDRPVPRGLISLSELAWVGAAVAASQLTIALWFFPPLSWLLIAVWFYLALMSAEFFAPTWLKSCPLIYLLSHMVILPLIALYAGAFHWWVDGLEPSVLVLAGFLALVVGNGLIFEIGRKVRAPADERYGVETYSSLWGSTRTSGAWAGAVMLAIAGVLITGAHVGDLRVISTIAVFAAIGAAVIARSHARQQTRKSASRLKHASEIIVLALLFSLCVPPMEALS